MSTRARHFAESAAFLIRNGNLTGAIFALQVALRETHNPRVWSKLMLAIRECNRALRASQQ